MLKVRTVIYSNSPTIEINITTSVLINSHIFQLRYIFRIFSPPMKIGFSGADDEFLNSNEIEIRPDEIERNNIKTLDDVITYIYKVEPRSRKSFFKTDGSLANGTICLIDEEDSEIRMDKEITSNSHIVFISTLHGG